MHDISSLSLSPSYMSKTYFYYIFSIELKGLNSRHLLLFDEAVEKWNIDSESFNRDSSLTT